jgi:hypothetical protein
VSVVKPNTSQVYLRFFFMILCIGPILKSGKNSKISMRAISKGSFPSGVQRLMLQVGHGLLGVEGKY